MPQHRKKWQVKIGQKFGQLTVLTVPDQPTGHDECSCRCVCGKVSMFQIHNLVSLNSSSCGCNRLGQRQSLIDMVFARLTVVGRDPRIGRRYWVCRCTCGIECVVPGTQLRRGQVKGCGCIKGDMTQPHYRKRGKENLGKGLTLRLRLFNGAQRRAKERDLPFNLCLDDIVIPEKCPIFGIEFGKEKKGFGFHSASLDRIVPELGYVKGNVQVISGRANLIKRDATFEELIALGEHAKLWRERLNQKAPEKVMQQSDLAEIATAS